MWLGSYAGCDAAGWDAACLSRTAASARTNFPGTSFKDVTALATLPSREELLAKLVGTMQAPVVKFVQTLNEVPGKFVRTLAAVRDSQAKQAA